MLDIIERLENDDMFVDAIDDAIGEILKLRGIIHHAKNKYQEITRV